MRRGRRKDHSVTSVLDSCSQLSRKTSVCKFPSLSFASRSRDEPHQPKRTLKKNATESTVVPGAGNQPLGSCQIKRAVHSAQNLDTPKRKSASIRKKNVKTHTEGAASSSRCLDESAPIQVTAKSRITADCASTPASTELSETDVSSVFAPPDVDTPKVIHEGSICPSSSSSAHWLLAQPCTPPCNQPPELCVADTPERDYGLKVTWRRRTDLMFLLKRKGYLSDSDSQIQS